MAGVIGALAVLAAVVAIVHYGGAAGHPVRPVTVQPAVRAAVEPATPRPNAG